MIFELDKTEFSKCRKLLNEQGQLEAKAIVENENPGRIFVDNINNPVSGLIWLGNNDGFIFFGSEQNENFNNGLNQFINNVIIPEAKKVQLKWFEGVGNHEKWNNTIERVFEHRKLGSWNQRVYILHKDGYKGNNEPEIDQGYKVIKICNTLYENKDNSIKNIEFLQSKILDFWPSPESFFNNGMGYCIVYENEIVSVCFSGFVVGNVHCIDIETLKTHQGKKLAQRVAHSFVKDCLDNNMVPYWDCMEINKPSVAVAENIGFRNVFNYVGYDFSFE
ncbi:GNAT family N-acetyltransferase [Oceanobacillus piezotolerans]|uniref:GNAT family N-acetyltransferase n=1 Tax=Oceanobacillus piezotolerans TaxID=2448030 RepID=A0A498DEH7_9BACI|nr:GNAT family N-acetyltransferase [Oceanobacillus piezotolerans]RLL48486.1 GNAT family N-acetyltransferase [Oceanobacillus piezotolerans]